MYLKIKEFNTIQKKCSFFYKFFSKNNIRYFKYLDFIHLLNSHPLSLNKYNFALKKKNFIKFFFIILTKIILQLFYITLNIFKKEFFLLNFEPKKLKIVFFSHMVNSLHINKTDFYFGNLPYKFNKRNCAIIYNNETKLSNNKLLKNYKKNLNIIFLSNYLGFFNELKIIKKIIIDIFAIFKLKKSNYVKKNNSFLLNLILDFFNNLTIKNIRFKYQIQKILFQLNPEKVVYTFEGHCYEKIIIEEVKKFNKDTKCIAYQHSVIFPHQPSLLKPKFDEIEPDIILTSGKRGKKELSKVYKTSKIIEIGNPRHNFLKLQKKNYKKICLFIPDGTIYEAKKMLSLIPHGIIPNQKIKFLFRFHPGVSEIFQKSNNKNIEFSENSLLHDLKKCSWVVYRGSGAIIHALNFCVRPIYYSYNFNEISVDPIIDVKNLKKVVFNFKDLMKILNKDINNNFFEKNKRKLLKNSKKTKNFFSLINYNLAYKILK